MKLPFNEEAHNSIVNYITESVMEAAPGDVVTLNPRFRGMYKAFKVIYGEVTSVDKVSKTARVDWETRRILPDVIPLSHLEIEDEDEDEDEEEEKK